MNIKFHDLFAIAFAIALLQSTAHAATIANAQFNVTFNVTLRTCSFNDIAPMVSLPEISAERFRNSGSEMVEWKDVDISIQCDSGIENVRIVPSGTPSVGDETAFANTGSAQNVGLRLMTNQGASFLYPDGSEYVSVNTPDGSGNYRFRAGYISTGGQVKAGTFLAIVNLSFDYS